jgi:antitoxin (DNA-binding transcriptional repressor) of toxin-antitoxin stability system
MYHASVVRVFSNPAAPGAARAELDKVTTGGYHDGMKAVGIKTLKAKLSEYIRLAKAGETVLVTERDEVVAEIRPARRQPMAPGSFAERLSELSEDGLVTLASEEIRGFGGLAGLPVVDDVSVDELLDEIRGDAR